MSPKEMVMEDTKLIAEIALIAQSVGQTYELVFGTVFAEDWKTYPLEEQISFRNVLEEYFAGASLIREKFDADVWKGHANGTVSPSVDSIRKQREGDTPGRKAEPVTAASLLAKRLKK
jgi:hypothetical protein